MSHYFETNPDLYSKKVLAKYTYKEFTLDLFTDAGVFSKGRVDFGTNLLLNSIEIDSSLNKIRILDLGCGYGIVGLALAKANKKAVVHLVDINSRAIGLAKENAQFNNIENVEIYESNIYDSVVEKFHYIITNPPIRAGKRIVHEMVLKSFDYLVKGGEIYIVIQKKQGAPSLIKALEEATHPYEIVNKRSGYCIIKAIKE